MAFPAAAMILAANITACEPKAADTISTQTAPVSEVITTEAATEEQYSLDLRSEIDFKNEEFVILTPKSEGWSIQKDFAATEGETGEVINDAAYERKEKLLEIYNVKITSKETSSYTDVEAKADITTQLNTFDAVLCEMTTVGNLAQNGLLCDLKSIETMHLDMPWYAQNSVKELSIANKLFFVLGDISLVDNEDTCAIAFNK
ncbi:MAG: hypothetical protein VB118_02840 [Oscillospiraceae bacterium]|nr:hypothetical protein [Oscillospiraceae bacterium]